MAAGDPWQGAKYSYGVWERFPDQENPFLELFFDPRNEARSLISILNSGAMSIPQFLTHPPALNRYSRT